MAVHEESNTASGSEPEDRQVKYIWKCACGKFQVKLLGEPLDDLNCFCHSCVSPVRYLKDKYPNATSAAALGGGASFCQFENTDTILPENADELVGYLHVGEKGKSMRTYTKCCGTQLHMGTGANFPANFRPLNRNGVYKVGENEEDLKPYTPSEPPVNVNLKFKYEDVDASNIPEPTYQMVPIGLLFRLFGRIGKWAVGIGTNPKHEGLKCIHGKPEDIPSVETVPITWEETGGAFFAR